MTQQHFTETLWKSNQPEPRTITLVRHGETFQNREGVVQGQDPTWGRLTPEGIQQAQLLGQRSHTVPFDAVYCSPLERAVLTMAFMLAPRQGNRTLPIVFADALKEINMGALQGRSQKEWKQEAKGQDPMVFKAKNGGENWLDVQKRSSGYFCNTILASSYQRILVVAHGGVNRGILSSLLGMSMEESWRGAGEGCPQDNTCVNVFKIDSLGKVQDMVVNDTKHLKPISRGAFAGQRWIVHERCFELLEQPTKTALTKEYSPF